MQFVACGSQCPGGPAFADGCSAVGDPEGAATRRVPAGADDGWLARRRGPTTKAAAGNTTAAKPYGNFDFRLVRSARGLARTDYHGKGALHCYASRPDALIVWSMTVDTT